MLHINHQKHGWLLYQYIDVTTLNSGYGVREPKHKYGK